MRKARKSLKQSRKRAKIGGEEGGALPGLKRVAERSLGSRPKKVAKLAKFSQDLSAVRGVLDIFSSAANQSYSKLASLGDRSVWKSAASSVKLVPKGATKTLLKTVTAAVFTYCRTTMRGA